MAGIGLALHSGVLAADVAFERFEIDADPPKNPWIKVVGDLAGDRRPEVIVGGSAGPLVWYENPSWAKHLMAAGGYDSVDGEVGDIDRNGDLDIVIGGILWYENPRPAGDLTAGPWKAHRIGRHRTHDVELADLDGDGHLDVVVRGQSGFGHKEGHRILIWRQNAPDDWTSRELACPPGEGLKLADLDADGDADIVVAARWYANPGSILQAAWRDHDYSTDWAHGECAVQTGDLNGDGRLDVVLSPADYQGGTYRISWFEAPSKPAAALWTERVVEPTVETVVHALRVADLDGNGMADIVTAQMHQGQSPQEVVVHFNAGRGLRWTKQVLSTRGSHNLVLADLDANGAIDIVGTNHGGPSCPVEAWRNRTK